jgi:hypothetical protein
VLLEAVSNFGVADETVEQNGFPEVLGSHDHEMVAVNASENVVELSGATEQRGDGRAEDLVGLG